MLRWISIAVAVMGLSLGVYAVATTRQEVPEVPLARQPSVNPFGRGISALGIVEPLEKTISVAVPEAGLVMEVFVKVGDRVEAGTPLLRLDGRTIEAELIRARAAVAVGESEIARWNALPRKEDVPPLEAVVAAAEARLADIEERSTKTQDAGERGAATEREVSRAAFEVRQARAELEQAKDELERVRAGGWEPDLAITKAQVQAARAQVESLQVLIDRLTVKATRGGTVLRRDVEPGEYAAAGGNARALLILGDLSALAVRAQVDEEDIALLNWVGGEPRRPAPKAVARTRGAVVREIPATLKRIEPFARPKSDLFGTNVERVDTRVIDVVLVLEPSPEHAIYPGQALDVFIDTGVAGAQPTADATR
jgi:multidrug efflux pump subunit AcrA (membrane-fusion protein)